MNECVVRFAIFKAMYGFGLLSLTLCSHMTGVLKPVMALCGGYRTNDNHAEEDEFRLHVLTMPHSTRMPRRHRLWAGATPLALALPFHPFFFLPVFSEFSGCLCRSPIVTVSQVAQPEPFLDSLVQATNFVSLS